MKMDASQFPVVWVRESTDDTVSVQETLAEYLSLLKLGESFVVIANEFPSQQERKQEKVEDRRAATLFMKAYKTELRQLIKGHIQIVSGPEEKIEAQQFSSIFEKFWGYPMLVVDTQEQAELLAATLLKGGS